MKNNIIYIFCLVIMALAMLILSFIFLREIDDLNNEIKNIKREMTQLEQLEENIEQIELTQNAVIEIHDNLNEFIAVHDSNVEIYNEVVEKVDNIIEYLNKY